MAARTSSSDVGPSAFEIKLGISTGRNSPDCDPETIVVSASDLARRSFGEMMLACTLDPRPEGLVQRKW